MDIRVLGWQYKNIRGGLRDVEIDLGSPPSRWSLIQMPNGTGKTTTMALFRALFSGESLTRDAVKDFRAADDAEDGLFEVRLSLDGKLWRLQLKMNFHDGSHTYWTVRSEVRSGGVEEGLTLPTDLRRLLSTEFVRLFVFDGELAKEIRQVGKERAANAIRTLYQLDQLTALSQQVEALVEQEQRRAASVSTATEMKGVRRWQNALDAATSKKTDLSNALKGHQKRRQALDTSSERLRASISDHIQQDSSLKKQKETLDTQRAALDRTLLQEIVRSVGLLRSPAKLHPRVLERLHGLGGKLTRLKLPKTISAEFFRELAEQTQCICGRPIAATERQAIVERANLYLAEDQIAVINKMKLALRESEAAEAEFFGATGDLKTVLRELRQNKTAHDQLELTRIEAGDTELERLRQEVTQAENDIRDIDSAVERITTKDTARQRVLNLNESNNLPLCEAEIKRCQEKLATITHTRLFMKQGQRVRELINGIAARALDQLRERVRTSTNDKLARLVPSEALQVARISGALELASGGLATKAGVSEGQSLAVAYAFLTSLLADAPYKLPFIVDSPAVSLDTKVRREVGELIPDLFGQMIMFVISSEREGFADAFYDRSGVRFLTLWREEPDATKVREGLTFFREFHSLETTA